jgi:hypothetical protein
MDHHDDRRRRQDRIGRVALLVGAVLVYWILLAAPWSDEAKGRAVLAALALVAIGTVFESLSTPDSD